MRNCSKLPKMALKVAKSLKKGRGRMCASSTPKIMAMIILGRSPNRGFFINIV